MSQFQLEGKQEYVDEPDRVDLITSALNDRIDKLVVRVGELERDRPAIQREAVVIVLKLLTESLRHVASGKMDLPDVSVAAPAGSDARWEAIKSRLAPRLREAVDVLLVQGPMRRTQLAAALKMDYSNCAKNVIAILIRQGIAIENGGHVTLKTL